MGVEFLNLEVTCPFCQSQKSINVPKSVLSTKKIGIVKVQVPPLAVCEHQFIIFLDPKGAVRGYEKIDVQMTMPKIDTPKEAKGILTLRKLTQIFGTLGLFSLIHAKVFNFPIYIINNNHNFDRSEDLLNLIADRLMPEKYRAEKTVKLFQETEYNDSENPADALVIGTSQQILQMPWEDKLKFEESMVKKALELIKEEDQLMIIQHDITAFVKEAEYTKDILNQVREITEKVLTRELLKVSQIVKKDRNRLKLIKLFVSRRYSPDLLLKIN